jgi:hypothetical protein
MKTKSPSAERVSARPFRGISGLRGCAIAIALLVPAALPGAASAALSSSRSASASLSNGGSTSVSLTGDAFSGDYTSKSFSGNVSCSYLGGSSAWLDMSASYGPGAIPAYDDTTGVADDASSAHVSGEGWSMVCGSSWPGQRYHVEVELTATSKNTPSVSGTTVTFQNSAIAAGTFCWVFFVSQTCETFTGNGTIQASRSVS